jgi:hypothetical protein
MNSQAYYASHYYLCKFVYSLVSLVVNKSTNPKCKCFRLQLVDVCYKLARFSLSDTFNLA